MRETAGLGYSFAGPVNAVSGSKSATDSRPRPPLLVGYGGHELAFSPETGLEAAFFHPPRVESTTSDFACDGIESVVSERERE